MGKWVIAENILPDFPTYLVTQLPIYQITYEPTA